MVCKFNDNVAKEIKQGLGITNLPVNASEYVTDENSPPEQISSVMEYLAWMFKQMDAMIGSYPIKIKRTMPDKSEKEIKLDNVSEALVQMVGMLLEISTDADAAVNVGTRAIAEALGARTAALQNAEHLDAISDWMGFDKKNAEIEIKVSFTPGAVGDDGKLQDSELEDFLKPSTQKAVVVKAVEEGSFIKMIQRILYGTEVSIAALYRPYRPDKDGENATVTGDGIREYKAKEKEKDEEKFTKLKQQIESQTGNAGMKIEIKQLEIDSDGDGKI